MQFPIHLFNKFLAPLYPIENQWASKKYENVLPSKKKTQTRSKISSVLLLFSQSLHIVHVPLYVCIGAVYFVAESLSTFIQRGWGWMRVSEKRTVKRVVGRLTRGLNKRLMSIEFSELFWFDELPLSIRLLLNRLTLCSIIPSGAFIPWSTTIYIRVREWRQNHEVVGSRTATPPPPTTHAHTH